MKNPDIHVCPGTLAEGYSGYSRTCLKRVFADRKVSHIFPYESPLSEEEANVFFQHQGRSSFSGVQEKFSVIQIKNKLQLAEPTQQGTHLLKSIPSLGKRRNQIPANEHLTMQIARQVYGIETAENALVFFQDGEVAYLTRRFDVDPEGKKWAQEDFASLAGRSSEFSGKMYKYEGNYLLLFDLMKQYLPAWRVEQIKLWRRLLFNYLFSNGDAHLKNFSVLETNSGDHILSPAYDLLNTRIHVEDEDFALTEGLLPGALRKGKVHEQFKTLAREVGIPEVTSNRIFNSMNVDPQSVLSLVNRSYLDDRTKRSYVQMFQTRASKLFGRG